MTSKTMNIPRHIHHDRDAVIHPGIVKLITDFPLAWVVSPNGEAMLATPLPLLGEYDADGRLVSLLGHLALANPHVEALRADGRATILFAGPSGYVSPRHVADPAWAPTWNYAVARFHCCVRLVAEESDAALRRLTDEMESATGGNWAVERMGTRYDMMQAHISAFRADIQSCDATFKLGQDESDADFAGIVAGLPDTELVEWMTSARG
jgi:transcriptional regulator